MSWPYFKLFYQSLICGQTGKRNCCGRDKVISVRHLGNSFMIDRNIFRKSPYLVQRKSHINLVAFLKVLNATPNLFYYSRAFISQREGLPVILYQLYASGYLKNFQRINCCRLHHYKYLIDFRF